MTIEEYSELLQLAKDRNNWTSELFKRYQAACIEMTPCIFNELRKIIPEDDYKAFDLTYCEYFRPEQKGVVKYLEELHRKEAAEQWKQKRVELLQKKRRLLMRKSKLLSKS